MVRPRSAIRWKRFRAASVISDSATARPTTQPLSGNRTTGTERPGAVSQSRIASASMANSMARRALLAGLLAAGGAVSARAAERAGEVQNSRGDCYAQMAAERRTLTPDAPVFVG